MSRRKRGGYRSNSRKNLICGIVIVILAALLGVLLWMSKVEDDKRSAELQVLWHFMILRCPCRPSAKNWD